MSNFCFSNLKETDELIFKNLSSKHRSEVCTVSKRFLELSVSVSKTLSKAPILYTITTDEVFKRDWDEIEYFEW